MDYFNSQEQLVKRVMKSGGSGSVYVPKDWIGQSVMVRPLSIKENVLRLLSPCMERVKGVYLYGSYARGEEDPDSDIDVLVITDKDIELAENGFDMEVVEHGRMRALVKQDPVGYYSMVREAVPIMNGSLLKELREIKPSKKGIGRYHRSTASALAIVKEFLELEGLDREDIPPLLYSLMLRLRGLYLIRCNLTGKGYSNAGFEDFLEERGSPPERYRGIYATYRAVREGGDVPKYHVPKKDLERLYGIAKEELGWQKGRRGQGKA